MSVLNAAFWQKKVIEWLLKGECTNKKALPAPSPCPCLPTSTPVAAAQQSFSKLSSGCLAHCRGLG